MISTHWLNQALDTILSSGSLYAGLSSTEAGADGTGYSEPADGNYTRVKIAGFTKAENGVAYNAYATTFPVSTSDWFTEENMAAYWLLFDGDAQDSNLLACGGLDTAKAIPSGVAATIPMHAMVVTLTDLGDG